MIPCITRVGGYTAIPAAASGLHSSIAWRTDRRTSYRCFGKNMKLTNANEYQMFFWAVAVNLVKFSQFLVI